MEFESSDSQSPCWIHGYEASIYSSYPLFRQCAFLTEAQALTVGAESPHLVILAWVFSTLRSFES